MRKLIVLLLGSISICLADVRVGVSSFGDNDTYIANYGAKALILSGGLEYSLNAERSQSPTRINDSLWAGVDGDVTKRISWFVFDSCDNGIWRQGVGLGYEFNDNILVPPWKHKVSVAIVADSTRGSLISYRYKFQGYYDGFGLAMTSFVLGYTYTIDYIVSYKLNSMASIINKGYYDDISKTAQSAVGIEIKL